jgi:hypothetical protein
MDILKRIDYAMEACRRLDVDMWSIDPIKWAERVNPDLIYDIYQYIESLQLKLMHEQSENAKKK